MLKVLKTRNIVLAVFLAVGTALAFAPAHAADAVEKVPGSMTPAEALEYMKNTPNLYILDARPAEMHKQISFVRSHNIPVAELPGRMAEIPKDVPVMIHCRLGVNSRKVYPMIKEARPDIEALSFIDGEPPFEAYNTWKAEKKAMKKKDQKNKKK